jgi:hypothetical protein
MGVWILSLNNPAYFRLLKIYPSEVQTLLKEAVDTLLVIGGESLMSRKAHHCIRQYIEFLASAGKLCLRPRSSLSRVKLTKATEQRMETNGLAEVDQAVLWAAQTEMALDSEPNLGDFLHSLDSEDALLGGLLGSERWNSEIHDIGLL